VSCEILPASRLHYELVQFDPGKTYGENYLELIKRGSNPYILNFHEDHFCVLDNLAEMKSLIRLLEHSDIQVCRASFWEIEDKCAMELYGIRGIHRAWSNNEKNHKTFSGAYPEGRYYIGTNNIMERQFAKKFWDRPIDSKRPHEYELKEFDQAFMHNCMVPAYEITASIDDDHGEPGSCLLSRNVEKFWNTWKLCNQDTVRPYLPNQ